MSATTIAVSSETKELLRQFGEKGESYNNMNCNVFCNRFPYFPKAIPRPAKTIARKDQKLV